MYRINELSQQNDTYKNDLKTISSEKINTETL